MMRGDVEGNIGQRVGSAVRNVESRLTRIRSAIGNIELGPTRIRSAVGSGISWGFPYRSTPHTGKDEDSLMLMW